jgi:hypothetical protein
MSLSDVLNRYVGTPQPQADTGAHFDQAAAAAAPDQLGAALSSMFRSDQTPPFAQIVGNLFNNSSPEQRASVLNHIVQALGPAAAGAGAGGILSQILGGAAPATGAPSITPEQASQVSAADVTKLATHAEQHNPSIVDTLGSFYAQHPTLVKSLGGMALAVALGHLRR